MTDFDQMNRLLFTDYVSKSLSEDVTSEEIDYLNKLVNSSIGYAIVMKHNNTNFVTVFLFDIQERYIGSVLLET